MIEEKGTTAIVLMRAIREKLLYTGNFFRMIRKSDRTDSFYLKIKLCPEIKTALLQRSDEL